MDEYGVFEGKFFLIKSQLNGLVLDIENNSPYPGAKVSTFQAKPVGENDNQIWYEDRLTGTIRSALNDFCLDIQNDNLVVMPYSPGSNTQEWQLSGNRISNKGNPNWVIDIAGNNSDPGARVAAYDYNGGANQHWTPDFLDPKFFVIKSKMANKVLDVDDAKKDPGTNVIIYEANGQDNQLWYEDRSGVIRSKINKYALDGTGEHIKLQPYDWGNPKQQWIVSGEYLCLRDDPNTVIDIEGGWSWDGTKLCPYARHGKDNQLFTIEYV